MTCTVAPFDMLRTRLMNQPTDKMSECTFRPTATDKLGPRPLCCVLNRGRGLELTTHPPSDLVYNGFMDATVKIFRNEGPMAFYRGFLPIWGRFAPQVNEHYQQVGAGLNSESYSVVRLERAPQRPFDPSFFSSSSSLRTSFSASSFSSPSFFLYPPSPSLPTHHTPRRPSSSSSSSPTLDPPFPSLPTHHTPHLRRPFSLSSSRRSLLSRATRRYEDFASFAHGMET